MPVLVLCLFCDLIMNIMSIVNLFVGLDDLISMSVKLSYVILLYSVLC